MNRYLMARDLWPAGPWDHEPDKLEWRYRGVPCLIVRGSTGALCGYVAVEEGHPWYKRNADEIEACVHGGITYTDVCDTGGEICHKPLPGESDYVWWVGFDCGHAWDLQPAMTAYRESVNWGGSYKWEHYRDIAYVKAEVEHLADQASEALP